MSYIELINFTVLLVIDLGFIAFLLSKKYGVSNVPLLIILGLLFGPVFNLIPNHQSHQLFNYIRVFGLVIILYTEGHNLKWPIIKKHLATIGILDTLGLLITAFIGGFFFSYLFHLPFVAGFLFGAIISATDPATLIPLFKQNKVDEDIETVIVTESVFNDPLGIVLTTLAIALMVPEAKEARMLETISHYSTLYPGTVIFFLYEIVSAILIGIILGVSGYWIVKKLKPPIFSELFGLIMALSGFFIGEILLTSGYLVATTIGIIFGNHSLIFKKEKEKNVKKFVSFLKPELKFNEKLSDLAGIFIFVLLGATIDLSVFGDTFLLGVVLALIIIFIARPVATLMILPLKKWTFKQYLFISLEGPRGIVPSAMSALPLSLGIMYHNEQLISWGKVILSATLATIIISEIVETIWVKYLSKSLLNNDKKS
jgi:NhaP-type Na+/H+ or K+/H+ antiporter